MLVRGKDVPNGTVLDADVCVVGAGPVGITIALELRRTGLRVCVLESGGEHTKAPDREVRGENVDRLSHRLGKTRARGFGGTSNIWKNRRGVRVRPFDPLDFVSRPEVDRPGWPINHADMLPWFSRANDMLRIDSDSFDAADWEDADARRLPAGPHVDTVVFQFAPLSDFGSRLSELRQCETLTVVLDATVQQLVTGADGRRVVGVEAGSGQDHRFTVRPRAVVLACGGIENARMLLLTETADRPALGNAHDLVGRYFMEHPHIRTGVLVASSTAPSLALYGQRTVGGASLTGSLAVSDLALRERAILASAWNLHPLPAARASSSGFAITGLAAATAEIGRLPEGTFAHLLTAARHPVDASRAVASFAHPSAGGRRTVQLTVMGEQAPNPSSRVLLGRTKDAFGRPVARLDWRLSQLDWRSLRVGQQLVDDALRRAGVGHLRLTMDDPAVPPPIVTGGHHHMGTTRMDPNPRKGVVDTDCRVHGCDNLYVGGSSVFPTSGYANPTLTALAVASRLADHLRGLLEQRRLVS